MKFNPSGLFQAQFYLRGSPVTITIDDLLPMHPSIKGKLAFAQQGANGALWAPLLEKAYAKALGTYESLDFSNM
jgi:hypothetical protein